MYHKSVVMLGEKDVQNFWSVSGYVINLYSTP
jgi:hypothetical protein